MNANEFDRHLGNYLKPLDGKKFNLKHLFFAENPLSINTYFYYTGKFCKRSSYFTQVYKGIVSEEKGKSKQEELDKMWEAGVLVWDIFHKRGKHKCKVCENIDAGEKISSDKRNDMIQENCSLLAFQSSVEALKDLIDTGEITVDENLSIYFMMPQLTSLPIFNHYNCPTVVDLNIADKNFIGIIREPNPLFTEDKDFNAEIFPRHMINVIGGSNTPRANLVKHARDCQGGDA